MILTPPKVIDNVGIGHRFDVTDSFAEDALAQPYICFAMPCPNTGYNSVLDPTHVLAGSGTVDFPNIREFR